ncbi:hypothetical protein PAXRUDRAFT_29060 [Paxillus rubicundulus Ve08.2h10]|uniref:Uncharacterized protein n=1 Tax=Paxillus rubicundulus Ve08.2h10 TaxID=930991 RepID=A0A0D0BWF2_9AGAM|nr:hypothetical protein PAXRUDRAFT_29060 [Paxillus rubicundulus Ve08.2h10]
MTGTEHGHIDGGDNPGNNPNPSIAQPMVFGVGPVPQSNNQASVQVPAYKSLVHSVGTDSRMIASDVWFAMVPVNSETTPQTLPEYVPSRRRPKCSHLACSFCL